MNAIPNRLIQCPLCQVKVQPLQLADHIRQRCRGTVSVGVCPHCAAALPAAALPAHLEGHLKPTVPVQIRPKPQSAKRNPDGNRAVSNHDLYQTWHSCCPTCGEVVPRTQLALHQKQHSHDEQSIYIVQKQPGSIYSTKPKGSRVCHICGYRAASFRGLVRHLQRFCVELDHINSLMKCPICETLYRGAALRQHLLLQCAPLVICPQCKVEVDAYYLRHHQRTKCSNPVKLNLSFKPGKINCPLCFKSRLPVQLYTHIINYCKNTVHHSLINCPWCDITLHPDSLRVHLITTCRSSSKSLPQAIVDRSPKNNESLPAAVPKKGRVRSVFPKGKLGRVTGLTSGKIPLTIRCLYCGNYIRKSKYRKHKAACTKRHNR